jgi:Kef-type K+ transport system membrane component KefB
MSFGVTPAKWSGTMWKIAGRFTLPSVRAAAPSNGMSKPRFSWIFCMMLMFLLFCFMSFFKIFAVFGAFHLPLILGLSSAKRMLKENVSIIKNP